MVSSTLLWQQLMRDREANAPWQKLRRNLLLFLQLLILAALVFALARPFIPVPSVFSGSVVVLLDSSASMLATDIEPNRFGMAKIEVARLIGEMSGNSQMSIIQVGDAPTILTPATSDKTLLRQALTEAQPTASEASWDAAFALAAGAAQGFRDAQIIIVSDGGLPSELPPLPVEPAFILVGESSENLAISALATRESEAGVQLFATVTNSGILPNDTLFNLSLDGTLFDSRRITVPAQRQVNLTWDLPEGTAVIEGRLSENEGDFLAVDDVAWTVHQSGAINRALVVTEGNIFLEQVFGVLPNIEAFRAPPGSDLVEDPFDIYVFDGTLLPDPPPPGDLLLINPQPGGAELLTTTAVFSNTIAVRVADDPLLQFVDWSGVNVRQAQGIVAPWAQTLVEAQGGPLIVAGEQAGRRIAVITFDLRQSDLPLQVAFPILMANITSWLSPGNVFDGAVSVQTGETVPIAPSVETTAVFILKPDGNEWFQEVEAETLLFNETQQPGLYQVTIRTRGGDSPAGTFAVNLFSQAESSIQPVDTIQVGQQTVETAVAENIGQREFWPWLLSIAFLILAVEWWVHHRGTRLPKLNIR